MQTTQEKRPAELAAIKEPANLSPRIRWLRDYYFKGAEIGRASCRERV